MNQPPEEFILVQEERLLAFVATCFEKSGIDAGHAAIRDIIVEIDKLVAAAGKAKLESLAGEVVQLRFEVSRASVYSFRIVK